MIIKVNNKEYSLDGFVNLFNSCQKLAEETYQQGKADGRLEVFRELIENIMPALCENDVDEEVINQCREMINQIKEEEHAN